LDDALNWLRNQDPNQADLDDPTATAIANLAGIDLPHQVNVDEKAKFVDEALTWLRSNDPNADDIDMPSLAALSNLAGKPLRTAENDEDRAKKLEEVLQWLRKNSHSAEDMDDDAALNLSNLPGLRQLMNAPLTLQNKREVLEKTLKCLRNNNPKARGPRQPDRSGTLQPC
jgi:hypothetical protein